MKKSATAPAKGSSPSKAPQQQQPQQSKKQAKKGKEKLAFDIPYDVDVPSLSDNSKINTIMGFIGQLIFVTSSIPRPPKSAESEEPPQKKAKIESEEEKKEGEGKEEKKEEKATVKAKRKEKTPKEKDENDLRMFVVGVNAVSRIVEKDEATAKKKVRCVVVVSSGQPASEDFVARHIAMCCASLKLPVCVLDTTSAELGKAFNVPSVMAFAVKTEEFFNEGNAPKAGKDGKSSLDKEDGKTASEGPSEVAPESEENVKRRKVADNLVSLITENQSNVALPWNGEYGELKPLKASPLQRNPSRIKQRPKKKPQPQKKGAASTKTK